MPEVILKVNGTRYGGWLKIRITRSIEQIAGTFELTVTERWAGQTSARRILTGDKCQVLVDKEIVITGYVDDVDPTYDANQHVVTITGRDKTGDLVDCSAAGVQLSKRTLLEVAIQECKPFGIKVRAETNVGGKFEKNKPDEGETVFESLEKIARIRAVLLISDGLGDLVIARAGKKRISTTLELGKNILKASGATSHRDLYSKYSVKGQHAGDDFTSPEDNAHALGEAIDKRIKRYRPLTIIAEEQVDKASAKRRAEWERNVRFGRSKPNTYTVQGWHHKTGLWMPNVLVPVRDPYKGINGDLLIAGVSLVLDENGSTTELSMKPREAFDLLPLPEPSDWELDF
ncbi:phage baseplate assembly protein [Sulfuriflexus mobilis]|uniref:phage baseplate assembly protein n=1 Tax=Sulfuriflexus mobilis TaxID=1811807 RepID=UPI000F8208C8|nr:hypothetical protein [Sulfuriflexus mobilis]